MALTAVQMTARETKDCEVCSDTFYRSASASPSKFARTRFCSTACAAISREASKRIEPKMRLLAQRRITDDGCWEWTGPRLAAGYGHMLVVGKKTFTHRLAYQEFVGPIPAGQCVLHRCDNPPCFNPEHLWLGTKGDNNRDCASKRRAHGFKTAGDANAHAVLTNAQARRIRELKAGGMQQRAIARLFGVREMIVSNIILGKTYREAE